MNNNAVKFYTHILHRYVHVNVVGDIISGLLDSDSDGSDCDMLPWQPDWFSASSDEDLGDDDEDE